MQRGRKKFCSRERGLYEINFFHLFGFLQKMKESDCWKQLLNGCIVKLKWYSSDADSTKIHSETRKPSLFKFQTFKYFKIVNISMNPLLFSNVFICRNILSLGGSLI